MKLQLMSVLFLIGAFISGQAWAGDSGCGLGSVIIQKNSKGLQLLSWTTNGILLTQPLGITSGTSGCSSSGLVKADKEQQYFVEINREDLSQEMARGQGEKLTAWAQMNGCQSESSQQVFATMAQKNFEKIFPSAEISAEVVIEHLQTEMQNTPEVMQQCQVASL